MLWVCCSFKVEEKKEGAFKIGIGIVMSFLMVWKFVAQLNVLLKGNVFSTSVIITMLQGYLPQQFYSFKSLFHLTD